MEAPVWISAAGDSAKTPVTALSEMLHSLSAALLRDASLLQFVSASITGVLTHHLGWVLALDETVREKLMGNVWQKAPFRAMLLESFGCLSPAHPSACKVVVRGENASQVREMLHILSFFVRCPNLTLCHAKSDNSALKTFVRSQSSSNIDDHPLPSSGTHEAAADVEHMLYGEEDSEDPIVLKVVPLPVVTLTQGKSITRSLYAGPSTSKRGGLFALSGELLARSRQGSAPVTPPRRSSTAASPRRTGSRNSSLDDDAAQRGARARVVQELLDLCAVTPFESAEVPLQRNYMLEHTSTVVVDCDKRSCDVFSVMPITSDTSADVTPDQAAARANFRLLMGFKGLPIDEDNGHFQDIDPVLTHSDAYHRRVKPSALIASALAMACQAAKLDVDTRACILFIERSLEAVYSHASMLHEILPLLERPVTVEALAIRLEALSLSSSDVTMLLGIYELLSRCGAVA